MKKQPITKLVALALALTMLPATALAVTADKDDLQWDPVNNVYYVEDDAGNRYDVTTNPDGTYTYEPDTDPTPDPDPVPPVVDEDPVEDEEPADTTPTTPSKPSKPAAPEAVVVETIDNVKTTTNENGQTVVTATIAVEDSTAPVAISEAAVDALVSQAQEGDIVAIVAETTGAVSAPATKLAELIEKTGNAVPMGNQVAAVAVNKALTDLAGGAEVKVEPVVNEDGTISVPVTAGGKTIAPEDVPGGIDVEVPVSYTEDEVAGVNAVKADKAEVELTWSISIGKLQVNLTVTGSIKVVLN